jgi:hypothetical protein
MLRRNKQKARSASESGLLDLYSGVDFLFVGQFSRQERRTLLPNEEHAEQEAAGGRGQERLQRLATDLAFDRVFEFHGALATFVHVLAGHLATFIDVFLGRLAKVFELLLGSVLDVGTESLRRIGSASGAIAHVRFHRTRLLFRRRHSSSPNKKMGISPMWFATRSRRGDATANSPERNNEMHLACQFERFADLRRLCR